MWHSPRQLSEGGKRYNLVEVAALVEPLGLMLDALRTSPPPEVVTEPILQRMETGELIFAAWEVFDALLGKAPHPPGGHPGYQEAFIAELLDQCCGLVELELAEPLGVGPSPARRAAWRSYYALCGHAAGDGRRVFPLIEHLELVYEDPLVHLSPLLTASLWQDMLLGDAASVVGEFLWDYDWRTETFLDRTTVTQAWMVAEQAGTDLDLVHQLPKSPTRGELAHARAQLQRWVDEHAAEAD